MTWHDELRKLDEGLAAGLISAEEYRARRDELLSAAAGAGGSPSFTPPGGQQQSIDSTQVMQPIRDNTPPPGNPEATQVVANGGAEATQVVRGWQPQQPPAGDADRTQVVPNAGGQPGFPPPPQQHQQPGFPASPPSGFPPPPQPFQQHQQQPPQQQPQTPWGDESNAAPPWGGAGDLPPLPPAGNEAWIRQGPEVFGAPSGKSSKVLPIIGIVVVLALVGGAVWFFGFRNTGGDPNNTATSNTSSVAPTTTTTQKPFEALPPGPGAPDPKSRVYDAGGLRAAELLAPKEMDAIEPLAAGDISYKGSTNEPFQYSTFVIETKDAAAAKELQTKLIDFGKTDGLVKGEVGGLAKGGEILQFIDDARALYRIVWTSGNKVIRVNVAQVPSPPQGPDRDAKLVPQFHALAVAAAGKFPGQ
ncbi:hypothetical protein [Crossiella sp. CA198]|uniref:hypothetical protein n=1 Tax=Crossiella sp. CA198 TaxID=3455607 RepID=UPI003F8D67FF